MSFRIGFGYDVHQLEKGNKLIIGGISIPHTKQATGHSDADVLIHAICDALLGAANLGYIAQHFPDTDDQYKGADSKLLLNQVADLLISKGYSIGNIDSTVCAEKPKIAPHISNMKESLSRILDIPAEKISIKATTNEKMGFVGKEEGIAAYAVCLIEKV